MKTSNRSAIKTAFVLGVASIFAGVITSSAALADDGWRSDRHDRIETDRRILREDEDHLRHLQHRLDEQTFNHEWHAAKDTRRDIDRTQRDIDRDQRILDKDLRR
jgi:hypothetical protein